MIDFHTAWCGPCQAMAPSIEELQVEYDGVAGVGKVDLDNFPSLGDMFVIQSVPTIIFFKDREEIKRLVGARTKKELALELQSFL
jgi:thioredoxin 1